MRELFQRVRNARTIIGVIHYYRPGVLSSLKQFSHQKDATVYERERTIILANAIRTETKSTVTPRLGNVIVVFANRFSVFQTLG